MAVVTSLRRRAGRNWSAIRTAVAWGVGALALYLAAASADWGAVGQRLAGLNYPMAAGAIVLALAVIYAKAVRWSLLLRQVADPLDAGPDSLAARPLGGRTLFPIVLAGQAVNNGLPLRVGELVRIEALANRGIPRLAGASTIVVEKLCDGCALALFAVVLSVIVRLPPWLNHRAILVGIAGAGILLAAGATIGPILRYVARRNDRLARLMPAVATGLVALRRPRVAAGIVGWTLASWVVGFLVNWAALAASHASTPLGALLLVTVASYAGGFLPSPPGRLGIFQYVCVLSVEAFGVDPTTAFIFAAVEYVAVVVVPSALGGLSLLLRFEAGRDSVAGLPGASDSCANGLAAR